MPRPSSPTVVIIGAGIVGLATAKALTAQLGPASVTLIEKESAPGRHQSSHNSGVLHAGVYYAPGSDKAVLCAQGRDQMRMFCREHDIPVDVCGKIVVATATHELARLEELAGRAQANGSEARLITRSELRRLEPSADGVAALRVPETAVLDFGRVCQALADDLRLAGTNIEVGQSVTGITEDAHGVTVTMTDGSSRRSGYVVNCAGLHSDRIAHMAGVASDIRIVPFRGEYHELIGPRRDLVRHLVYPVPDPRFPFLGVHFTRGIDGAVHVGPNAVLALGRESYSWKAFDLSDTLELARYPGLWRLGAKHVGREVGEVTRSLSRRAFARAARRLVPAVRSGDLRRAGAGVRAQAIRPDGTLLDDFAFEQTLRTVHVINAPSPAATSSLAIGDHVAQRVVTLMGAEQPSGADPAVS